MPELIDKAKLLEYLAAIKPDEYVSAYGEAAADVINHVEEYVNEMPAIEPEVRHGRWITHDVIEKMKCSECGEEYRMPFDFNANVYPYNFCPNCGAKMIATDTNVGGKWRSDSG